MKSEKANLVLVTPRDDQSSREESRKNKVTTGRVVSKTFCLPKAINMSMCPIVIKKGWGTETDIGWTRGQSILLIDFIVSQIVTPP